MVSSLPRRRGFGYLNLPDGATQGLRSPEGTEKSSDSVRLEAMFNLIDEGHSTGAPGFVLEPGS